MRGHSTFHTVFACIVACNYFAFRVEIFEEEYEHNHPRHAEGIAFNLSSLNWETFDKDNAPKAFIVSVQRISFVCGWMPAFGIPASIHDRPHQPIRDKSPPSDPRTCQS